MPGDALDCLSRGNYRHCGARRAGCIQDTVHQARVAQGPDGVMNEDQVSIGAGTLEGAPDRLLPVRAASHAVDGNSPQPGLQEGFRLREVRSGERDDNLSQPLHAEHLGEGTDEDRLPCKLEELLGKAGLHTGGGTSRGYDRNDTPWLCDREPLHSAGDINPIRPSALQAGLLGASPLGGAAIGALLGIAPALHFLREAPEDHLACGCLKNRCYLG
jgi:hypothetical protein